MIKYCDYEKKLRGAFVGKTVGGTLGMKYEGDINPHTVTYYDPVPTEMIANDDLDLQVVNLEILLHKGLPITRFNLGDNWRYHVADSNPDEYGVASSNHRLYINAPLSGIYRNKFTTGMGGAIRSELWACLFPGRPDIASMIAKEDACTDHSEDGIYSEMFLAAVESQAFIENDIKKLVEVGLKYIDKNSVLFSAFDDVINTYEKTKDVMAVRKVVLDKYYSDNWTNVIINLSFILLSLISCEGSFDKAICTASSLGYDTDCTAATVGSIMGILNPDSIDEKWTNPIGNQLVISANVVNVHHNATIDEFCDTILSISPICQEYYSAKTVDGAKNFLNIAIPVWTTNYAQLYDWKIGTKESILTHNPLTVVLEYPENIALIPEQKTAYTIKLINTNNFDIQGKIKLNLPYGFEIDSKELLYSVKALDSTKTSFNVKCSATKQRQKLNVLTLSVEANGLTFASVANLPLSRRWQVENKKDGSIGYYENTSTYFDVPQGEYVYKIKVNSTTTRQSRISCGGTRPFVVKINGKVVYTGDGKYYVPQFHRDGTWVKVDFEWSINDIEVYFPEHNEGEFFFGISSIYNCAEWIDYMEYYTVD